MSTTETDTKTAVNGSARRSKKRGRASLAHALQSNSVTRSRFWFLTTCTGMGVQHIRAFCMMIEAYFFSSAEPVRFSTCMCRGSKSEGRAMGRLDMPGDRICRLDVT
eukprot:349801-Chlamydomonas_euryale.AAC.41